MRTHSFCRRLLAALALLPGLHVTPVQADADTVRRLVSERMGNPPESYLVRALPDLPLYEVFSQADHRIVYVDEKVTRFLIGDLFDAGSKQNLSQARLEELDRVPFDTLPLDRAIRVVHGKGRRRVAVFADPDCPFCRQLEQTLADIDDVTVYVLLLPLASLHPDAETRARDIWCAADPGATWLDYLRNRHVPAHAQCDTPVREVEALAGRLHIDGTPTLVFADGRVRPGTIDRADLEKALDAAAAAGLNSAAAQR